MDPFVKSKNIKKQVDYIIYKKGLNNILKKYGKTFYTGSYFLNVMIWPDIDIELSLKPDPFSIELFYKIGMEIASKLEVVNMTFYNRIDFPIHEKGLYWNIILKYENDEYNIDLWSYPENVLDNNINYMEQLKKKITPEKRKKVVEIKSVILKEDGETPKFSGYYIYQAILDKNLEKKEEIINYLKNNGVEV